MNKIRILLIINPGIPVPPTRYGGIERIVYLLAEEYTKMGHAVTLLAGPDSHCSGHSVTFGSNDEPMSTRRLLRDLAFVWTYLLANHKKFDLVHNFGRLIYLLPILNKSLHKIMSYQRQVSHRGIKIMSVLPNTNLFFSGCSDYCVSTGNVAGRWKTIYNGIDFEKYNLNPISHTAAPLMFLGRLDRIKGVHTAIKVAKATGNKLLIAGNIPQTADNYAYFKSDIEPIIDGAQIQYIGELDDAQKDFYLQKAKALLFPIEWDEPFGIVMIEAMACGTPVIGFKRGAVPEVIKEEISGYIVDTIDEMIERVFKLEIDRAACRGEAYSRFNINKIASEYLSVAGFKVRG